MVVEQDEVSGESEEHQVYYLDSKDLLYDCSAHFDGGINQYAKDYYVATENSEPGRIIANLRRGDKLIINDHYRIAIEGSVEVNPKHCTIAEVCQKARQLVDEQQEAEVICLQTGGTKKPMTVAYGVVVAPYNIIIDPESSTTPNPEDNTAPDPKDNVPGPEDIADNPAPQ